MGSSEMIFQDMHVTNRFSTFFAINSVYYDRAIFSQGVAAILFATRNIGVSIPITEPKSKSSYRKLLNETIAFLFTHFVKT